MPSKNTAPSAEVVLIGSGHCHLEVLYQYSQLAIKPFRLTLVSNQSESLYKGYLYRFLAKDFISRKAFVDIGHLCHKAEVRHIKSNAKAIDLENKEIRLEGSSLVLNYDALSLDIGALPFKLADGSAQDRQILSLKPLDHFLKKLRNIEDQLISEKRQSYKIIVVGGDLRSMEVLFALKERYSKLIKSFDFIEFIFVGSSQWAPVLSGDAWNQMTALMNKKNITYYMNAEIEQWDTQSKQLVLKDGTCIEGDLLILTTNVVGQPLAKESGLQVDNRGLVRINQNLESASHGGVYAGGSCASWSFPFLYSQSTLYDEVMANTLAQNLIRRFTGLSQIRCRFSDHSKRIIYACDTLGIKAKGDKIKVNSSINSWKQKQDERWLKRYQTHPTEIKVPTYIESGSLRINPQVGPGDKIPKEVLGRLSKEQYLLNDQAEALHHQSLHSDASILPILDSNQVPSHYLLQAIDSKRAFDRNLHVFAKVVLSHTLNHIYALGATPQSILCSPNAPFGPKDALFEDIKLLMQGVKEYLSETNIALIGGHSACAIEASLGILAQAVITSERMQQLWCKQNIELGDHLVITKPLGTGVLMAGYQSYHLSSKSSEEALRSMIFDHGAAVAAAQGFEVRAATNISGYGLANNVCKLIGAKELCADFVLEQIPVYPEVGRLLKKGFRSSIHTQNRLNYTNNIQFLSNEQRIRAEILFDPQTSGPLLLIVPPSQSEALIHKLQAAGYTSAKVIGEMKEIYDPTLAKINVTIKK